MVGADGRHSAVAKAVARPPTASTPRALDRLLHVLVGRRAGRRGDLRSRRARRLVGAWPTNDGLVMTYVAAPASEFHAFRADPEGAILAALDRCGDLGERVRAGERAERVFGTADTQNRFHKPYGPGWALVGDAGLVMDPVTGAGHRRRAARRGAAAESIAAGLDGGPPLDEALAGYQAARDAAALPMYEMTIDLASFAPPRPEQEMLMRALEGNQAEIDRFLSVLTGSLPAAGVLHAAQHAAAHRGARALAGDALAEEDAHMSEPVERSPTPPSSAPRRPGTPPASAPCSSATGRGCMRSR